MDSPVQWPHCSNSVLSMGSGDLYFLIHASYLENTSTQCLDMPCFHEEQTSLPPNNNKVLPARLMCARCAQQIRLAATQSSTSSFDIQPRIYAARCKEMLHGSKDGTEYVTLILYARSISESLEEKPGWGGGEDISSTRCLTKDRREELQTKAFKTKLKWRKTKSAFCSLPLFAPVNFCSITTVLSLESGICCSKHPLMLRHVYELFSASLTLPLWDILSEALPGGQTLMNSQPLF